jgi:hypothetical protein
MKFPPEYIRTDPKSLVRRLTAILLSVLLTSAARQSRAETWCGDGPGTGLSHPCADADDDNPAVDDAIAKYRDQWMRLKGVWNVDQSDDPYNTRVVNIEVHVESTAAAAVRKQIPSLVDGIPIVIVPGEIPGGLDVFEVGAPSNGRQQSDRRSSDPAQGPSLVPQDEDPQDEDREKDEELYNSVVQKYGYHWMDLPGVTGIVPAKCDRNGCDFKTVGVTVQRQLLPDARKEIPASINGERILLIPDD